LIFVQQIIDISKYTSCGFNYLIEVIEVSVASVQLIEINTTTAGGGVNVRVRVAVGRATVVVHMVVAVGISVVVVVRVDVGHRCLCGSINSGSSWGSVTSAGVLAGDKAVVVVIE
jgi:hypothetical protein